MILKATTDEAAERFLKVTIKDKVPSAYQFLTREDRWPEFKARLHERCNQLDLIECVPSRAALIKFCEDATRYYARTQLDKAGMLAKDY